MFFCYTTFTTCKVRSWRGTHHSPIHGRFWRKASGLTKPLRSLQPNPNGAADSKTKDTKENHKEVRQMTIKPQKLVKNRIGGTSVFHRVELEWAVSWTHSNSSDVQRWRIFLSGHPNFSAFAQKSVALVVFTAVNFFHSVSCYKPIPLRGFSSWPCFFLAVPANAEPVSATSISLHDGARSVNVKHPKPAVMTHKCT